MSPSDEDRRYAQEKSPGHADEPPFDNLPEGWATARVAEFTTKVGSGATPRGGSDSYKSSGIPLVRSQNVHFDGFRDDGLAFIDDKQAEALNEVTVRTGDVLLNITGASIGRVTTAPQKMEGARVNQHVCIVRSAEGVLSSYLSRYLASPSVQDMIMTAEYGVTRQALTKGQILAFEIPLPPLPEQKRIVAKVEALLARVNAARERLAKAPAILKRFRQSVLAAACSGQLTAEWRDAHSDVESAQVRKARLLTQRERLWRRTATGTQRYKPPFDPPDGDLPDLPETWCWATVSHLALQDVGFAFKSADFVEQGVRLLRGENVEPGSLRWQETRCMPRDRLPEFEHLLVEEGDIILAMDRPVISSGLKIARAKATDLPCLLVQRVMRFRMVEKETASFLYHRLRHTDFIDFLTHSGMTGSDLPHITGTGVAEFPVPLCPVVEQCEIVRRVEAMFALADKIEARVQAATARVGKITQAILAKAFRGELVATEAELARQENRPYEPASALLDRIRAARANSHTEPGKTRATSSRGRKARRR